MKTLSFILLFFLPLFIPTLAFGQRVIDTAELYNGELTRKRIELGPKGDIAKEIYYHHNGKVQTEDFFENGRAIRTITYDATGRQLSEWNDPEIGHAIHRKQRNVTFLITLMIMAGLAIIASKVNYVMTYYSLFFLTVLSPLISLLAERHFFEDDSNPVLKSVMASLLFILPALLLILSSINFFKKGRIPIVTSIFALLISLGFLVFYATVMKIAGAGMIG